MKPFLLIATRAEDAPADDEYAAFLEAGGLAPSDLVRIRLEQRSLPDIDLTAYSGIIVGGSPFTSSDEQASKSKVQLRVEAEMAELVDRVIEDDFPFLGACYGIGLVGSHLGGIVDKTFGEPIGQVRVDITPAGSADPLFAGLETPFEAFVGHKEACSRLPDGAVLLASSTGCPVQAFRLGRNVYATQFHPELDVPGIVTRIHAYRDFGYFDPETMDALIEHVSAASVVHPSRIVAAFVGRYASAS